MHIKNQEKVLDWINKTFKSQKIKDLYVEFPDNQDISGGFTGDIIIAKVTTIEEGKCLSFDLVIKGKIDDEHSSETLNFNQEYANEVVIYSEIVPCFQNLAKKNNSAPFDNIPKCYGVITANNQNIVLMENLTPKKYIRNDAEKTLDLYHIQLVLEAYAKWHAFSFALKDQEPELFKDLTRKYRFIKNDEMFEMFINTIHCELKGILEYNKRKSESNIIGKLENLIDSSRDMFWKRWTNKDEDHTVIYHGDCWNNNYLFHYDEQGKPDKVVLIDWQSGGSCSPLYDVTSFLFWCCAEEELKHSDDLLKFYYKVLSEKVEELGSEPDKCFPWEVCLKSFKKYVPIAVAAMPLFVRLSYRMESEEKVEHSNSENPENFFAMYGEKMRNPDHYYQRVNGILNYCIKRGYL